MELKVIKTDKGYVAISDEARTGDCALDMLELNNPKFSPIISILGNTNIVTESFGTNRFMKIIATSFQLGNLPQFDLPEDNIRKLATEHLIQINDQALNTSWQTNIEDLFISGYRAAQEKYKYTEEDLRKAYTQGSIDNNAMVAALNKQIKVFKNFDEYIKSLNQPKELIGIIVETDKIPADRAPNGWDVFPKVIDNKLVIKEYLYSS